MRFGYADPPYPGRSHLYRGHLDYAGEVDHRRLAEQLVDGYPDGWALSTDARSLPVVLSYFAGVDVSVAAWFRRLRPNATARRPVSAWEPVIFAGGRLEPSTPCRYDGLICRSGPRTTDPARMIGAKPAGFAYWMFDLLGARPGDELDDLFPGSGGISRAWQHYSSLDVGHDASLVDERHASAAAVHDASLVDERHASCVDRGNGSVASAGGRDG